MNKADRDTLRKLALENPQGPWFALASKENGEVFSTVECNDFEHQTIATCGVYDARAPRSMELARNNRRARYIAAARPEQQIKLLDMVDRYEQAIEQKCHDCPGRRAGMCDGCALDGVLND